MKQQKGFIFKSSGAWYLKYREDVVEDGKVTRKLKTHRLADVDDYCRTESDAKKLAADFLRPLNEGRLDARSTMTLTDFVEAKNTGWLAYIEDEVRPATEHGYKQTWELYIKPQFGRMALRDIRRRDVVPYLRKLSTKTGSRVAKYAKTVGSMIFNYAILLEVMDSNPFAGKMLPKTKRTQQPVTELNEFSAMLHALKDQPQARAALGLTFFGALRPSEVRGLKWPNYDPRSRQMLIQCSRWGTEENETKTDEATALVPVNDPLADLLGELWEHDGRPSEGYVLRGERGGSLNLANLARRVIVPTLKAVGIEWRGYYAMRRGAGTIATIVARDKGLAAKGLLRHKTLSTTTEYYIDSVPSETRLAVEEVGRLFHNCSIELQEQSVTATKQK